MCGAHDPQGWRVAHSPGTSRRQAGKQRLAVPDHTGTLVPGDRTPLEKGEHGAGSGMAARLQLDSTLSLYQGADT